MKKCKNLYKKSDSKLKKLYVREDIDEYRYLYMSKKIANSIAVLVIVLIVGLGIGVNEYGKINYQKYKEIIRVREKKSIHSLQKVMITVKK